MSDQERNEEIKPCPFCGGKGEVRNIDDDIPIFRFCCIECVTYGPEATAEKSALILWNNRVI